MKMMVVCTIQRRRRLRKKNEEEEADDDEGQGSTHHASRLLGVLQGIRMDVVVCASYTMYVIVERSLLHRLGQRRN